MSNNEVPPSPTWKHAKHYNMKHRKRGIAVIFNHEFYKEDWANHRAGTNVDCENLAVCLGNLGFDVKDHHNLEFSAINRQLRAVSEIDHTEHDCLVVAVLTHGVADTLFAYDTPYSTNILTSHFTSDKCKTLTGKPKIFFIQACRGSKADHGSSLRKRTETDGSGTYRIPCHADFLIAYATIPGFYSWRNTERGSWFIEALCLELQQSGSELDLLTLLTFVCQRVALEYESYDPECVDFHEKKQIPCITSMLTRLVKFECVNMNMANIEREECNQSQNA